jgi:4-carboxymuconolactone decarboxylase
MSALTERGLELVSEIRGAERAAEMRDTISGGGFGSAMMALAVDFVFGSIWTRPGLDRKQRSLVTLGILIALRGRKSSRTTFRSASEMVSPSVSSRKH